jgi:hypothetical protein
MGFRPEVENFQPYYVHSKKYMKELRIGASIITETLDRESLNAKRAVQNTALTKEAREEIAKKVSSVTLVLK